MFNRLYRSLPLIITLLCLPALTSAKTLLILGDSLSAAYGIKEQQGWVQLLRDSLAERGQYRVINASVSGETSGGGLARLPALLETHQPDIVVVELGGNDGLRGHPIKLLDNNLSHIVALCRDRGAEVLLLGIQIPPNYGARYTNLFSAVYSDLATRFQLPLVPFFLDQIATRPEWMQADGIHPKAEAQAQMLENVMPHLRPLL